MKNLELIDALKRIQMECNSHAHCDKCPLGNYKNECMIIKHQPNQWNVEEVKC